MTNRERERAYDTKWHREARWKKVKFCITPLGRIMQKVDRSGECWEWMAGKSQDGYGQVKLRGHQYVAHRVIYEMLRAPIAEGLEIDHLCRNRACVNPDHLEPVTPLENKLRGHALRVTCPQGHPYSHREGNGLRRCRICQRRNAAATRERQRQRVLSPNWSMSPEKETR